jgi:beta-glucosidase
MSEVDAEGARSVMAGEYTVWLGGGQPGTTASGVSAKFSVTGTQALPK